MYRSTKGPAPLANRGEVLLPWVDGEESTARAPGAGCLSGGGAKGLLVVETGGWTVFCCAERKHRT